MGESTSNEGSATTDGNALPSRDPPNVTRFRSATAKRVQAHRARARMGLRCLTVRIGDGPGDFEDFQLRHHDLDIRITDELAAFYRYEDGTLVLDHEPAVLGLVRAWPGR